MDLEECKFERLAGKALCGEMTEEEFARFERYVEADPERIRRWRQMRVFWNSTTIVPTENSNRIDRVFDRVWDRVDQTDPDRKAYWKLRPETPLWRRYASVVALLLVFVAGYWTANVSPVILGEDPVSIIIHRTEKGHKILDLRLPDGSKVWLNADSELRYPKRFDGERNISLKGEAYFEVKKDSLRPFKVSAGKTITTALGTAFNISTYKDREAEVVSLTEGKVLVEYSGAEMREPLMLTPGEEAVVKEGAFNKRQGDFSLDWTKGVLEFKDTKMSEVLRELERWYGIPFEVVGDPDKLPFYTGSFDNENLRNVLDGIRFHDRFEYRFEEDRVVLDFSEL
ncbi:anti-sigma factor [Fulvitalea axinellae]|uniref:Anti-sigma factor n=2 Tax=Fulvitalea axinellae TaxID=1182444 RepID=A0AAU9CQD5_9BACT|nr:anti-sigma factor [Fulvitalea axinellae]